MWRSTHCRVRRWTTGVAHAFGGATATMGVNVGGDLTVASDSSVGDGANYEMMIDDRYERAGNNAQVATMVAVEK